MAGSSTLCQDFHQLWPALTLGRHHTFSGRCHEHRTESRAGEDLRNERERSRWYDAISGRKGQVGAWEAAVAMFMLLLPNLSTLSLPCYHDTGEDEKCIPVVVARAVQLQDSNIPSPYALKNLRNIELGILSDDEAVHWKLKTFYPFKSIRSIASAYSLYNDFHSRISQLSQGPFHM